MTMLGTPAVPAPTRRPVGRGVEYSDTSHHFEAPGDLDVAALAGAMTVPLSVIVQVTKRCNFDCNMCSETLQMPDPTMGELDTTRQHLAGTARVFLSGGEPLLRADFSDIVDMWHKDAILAVPTNAPAAIRSWAAVSVPIPASATRPGAACETRVREDETEAKLDIGAKQAPVSEWYRLNFVKQVGCSQMRLCPRRYLQATAFGHLWLGGGPSTLRASPRSLAR